MASSINGIVIYKSRYGATQQYGEWIANELRLPVVTPERLDDRILTACDFLIIGAPVYMGKILLKDWLKHEVKNLRNKKLFFFIVCAPTSETAQQKEIIKDNIPMALMACSEITFLPGRTIIKDLSTVDGLMLKIGSRLEKDPAKKAAMSHDIDAVKKENITELLKDVKAFFG